MFIQIVKGWLIRDSDHLPGKTFYCYPFVMNKVRSWRNKIDEQFGFRHWLSKVPWLIFDQSTPRPWFWSILWTWLLSAINCLYRAKSLGTRLKIYFQNSTKGCYLCSWHVPKDQECAEGRKCSLHFLFQIKCCTDVILIIQLVSPAERIIMNHLLLYTNT